MKTHTIDSLVPNSYFTDQVYLENEYIILSPDIPVTRELIDRLKKWNYQQIYSEGDCVVHTHQAMLKNGAESGGLLDKTIQEKEKHESIMTFYFNLISFMDEYINNFKKKNEIDLIALTEKVKEIINLLKEDKDGLLSLTAKKHPPVNYFIPHIVNTTIISLAIGDYLKLPLHKLIDLGLSGLLHEIGMTKIPVDLLISKKELTIQEKKAIASHTLWGYKILKNFSVPENIAQVALEHHERKDGSGYPRRMVGDVISMYAKIIGIACAYETSVAKRPYKNSIDAHKVMMYLLTSQQNKYNDAILKALVCTLSIFPLGTCVILSDNSKGIVYKTDSQNPKYPVVKLMVDENGNNIDKPILIKTSLENGLTIKRTIKPEEM